MLQNSQAYVFRDSGRIWDRRHTPQLLHPQLEHDPLQEQELQEQGPIFDF